VHPRAVRHAGVDVLFHTENLPLGHAGRAQ
jgi:hypothetical protein